MSNKIIKFDLFNNAQEAFVPINPTKQQLTFFPKEESQMFQGKSYRNMSTRPVGYENDPATETENNDTRAFINSSKATDIDAFTEDANAKNYRYSWFNLEKLVVDDPVAARTLLQPYRYGIYDIPSSHTPTDYIGSSIIEVPYLINQTFCDFNFVNSTSSTLNPLFSEDDVEDKIQTIVTGLQRIRIPINIFNTILETSAEIEENGGDDIVPNYGKYYIVVSPKYIQSSILSVIDKEHIPWRFMDTNAIDQSVYTAPELEMHLVPEKKRRTIYELSKTDFENTAWNFDDSPNQSGRLYGSVVEVWDSGQTQLKQIKVMTENQFNFSNSQNFQCVLQPDIMGYDVDTQDIGTSDVLRIYPRETYFDQFIIEVDYKNQRLQVENLIAYLTNDTVRDMKTGIFETYDENGFSIDTAGQFNGTVINRYQIFQKDRFEARKNLDL